MKRRRILLAGAAGVLLSAARALAQQPARKYRIAALFTVTGAYNAPHRAALKERLASHGFVEGKNLSIDLRITSGLFDAARKQVAEQLAAKPDAIFTMTTRVTQAALADADRSGLALRAGGESENGAHDRSSRAALDPAPRRPGD